MWKTKMGRKRRNAETQYSERWNRVGCHIGLVGSLMLALMSFAVMSPLKVGEAGLRM